MSATPSMREVASKYGAIFIEVAEDGPRWCVRWRRIYSCCGAMSDARYADFEHFEDAAAAIADHESGRSAGAWSWCRCRSSGSSASTDAAGEHCEDLS